MAEIFEVSRRYRISTNVDYNQFFNPNICHVCKSTDQNNLFRCVRCHMISYCSMEHERHDRSNHGDICTIITKFIDEDPQWDTHRLSFDEWMRKQKNFMQVVEVALGRKLKIHEVQMFIFAKVCFICHQRRDLYTCGKCISVSYCKDHLSERSMHLFICDDLALCLNLDIIFLEKASWKTIQARFSNFPSKKKSLIDMNSFCCRYFKELTKRKMLNFNEYSFTDYVSGPLTLQKVLQITNLFHLKKIKHTFVIHIIGANYVDKRNFPSWELFLHLLKKKMRLIIVMIGSELQNETNEHNVCDRCKSIKKKLIFESFPLLYHNYIYHENYRRPNVIVSFQAELNYSELWSDSIKAMQRQNCPVLLTAKSQLQAHWNMVEIRQVLGTSVKATFHAENYFVSCRPYRDIDTGHVFHPNIYLVFYKTLNVLSKCSKTID